MPRREVPASDAMEALSIGDKPLRLMPPDALRDELVALRTALGLPKKATPTNEFEDDEWEEIMKDLLRHLGNEPGTGSEDAWSRSATSDQQQAVGYQIARALAAIRAAGRASDGISGPTGLLLPADFPERMRFLLGYGELPAAWVRRADLLHFRP